jgi:4-hydroxy-tetrahydrodipicolinate reductase
LNLAVVGRGRMGTEVERLARAEGHTIQFTIDLPENTGGAGLTPSALSGVEAVIDFSQPEAVMPNIRRVAQTKVPMVVGTTGWYDGLDEARRLIEQHGSALVFGANFSIGANLFLKMGDYAARLFDLFPEYDPYVVEHHHRDKVDAPSGTALRLAERLLERTKRKTRIQTGNPTGKIAPDALQVASLRAGAAFGRHTLAFDSPTDTVELVHTARNREGFARGALFAAKWIRGKKGVFEFADLLTVE